MAHKLNTPAYKVYFTNNCPSGKRCYLSKGKARDAAKQLMRDKRMDKLIPYVCPHCSEIHLAHPRRNNG